LFDNFGKPRGRSFNITTSSGLNGNAIVRGLPSGGFVVLWDRYMDGVYFRVFDHNGKPQTKEVKVFGDSPQPSLSAKQKAEGVEIAAAPSCKPFLWVSTTKEGTIDVFINCNFYKYDKTSPFDFAQRFDSEGKSLTYKLTGVEMKNLQGYKHALDQYVKDIAGRIDVSLRHDFQGPGKCQSDYQYGFLVKAAETKPMTNDQRMKNFFTEYCRTYQKNCNITPKYVKNNIDACMKD
jgi:hypothetical protein